MKPASKRIVKRALATLACSGLLLGAGPCAVPRSGDDLCVSGTSYVNGVCVTDEPVESADNVTITSGTTTTQKFGGTGFIFGGGPQFYGPNVRNRRSLTGAGDERWVAIALDTVTSSSTKIVVAGYGKSGTGATVPLIARYDTYGNLDTTFNSKGYVVGADINPYGGTITVIRDMKLDSEGRILIAGYATATGTEGTFIASTETNYQHTYLARYTSAGALDTSFGSKINPNSSTSLRFGVVLEPFKVAPAQDPSTTNVGGYFGGTTGTAGYVQDTQLMNSFNAIAIDEYDGVIAVGQLGYDTTGGGAWRGQALIVRLDYNGDYYPYFYQDTTNEKNYKGYLRVDFTGSGINDYFDTLYGVHYDSANAQITAVGGTDETFLGTTGNKRAVVLQLPSTAMVPASISYSYKTGTGYLYKSLTTDSTGNFLTVGWKEDGTNYIDVSGCSAPAASNPSKVLERKSFIDAYDSSLTLLDSYDISTTAAISSNVDFWPAASLTKKCSTLDSQNGANAMKRDTINTAYIETSTGRIVVGGHIAYDTGAIHMDDPTYSIGGSYHHYSILAGLSLSGTFSLDTTFGVSASGMIKSSSYSASVGYSGGADAILALTQDSSTGYLYGAGYSVQYVSSGGATGYYRQGFIVRYDSTGAALK